MAEIKFTRLYEQDNMGNRYVIGYKCSDKKYEIRKTEVYFEEYTYDVYVNGKAYSFYDRLKDAKECIKRLIAWEK